MFLKPLQFKNKSQKSVVGINAVITNAIMINVITANATRTNVTSPLPAVSCWHFYNSFSNRSY